MAAVSRLFHQSFATAVSTDYADPELVPSKLPKTVLTMKRQQPRFPSNNYLTNGAPGGSPAGGPNIAPVPGAAPLLPNQGRVVQSASTRVLCVADVRGNLTSLNELAKSARADYIVHTGDFGFYDDRSLDRIADKTLKHVAQYSPLLTEDIRRQIASFPPSSPIKEQIPRHQLPLSQLEQFLSGTYKFDVPVYAVWGACEDVQVLEKLRTGEYRIDNLHILDEAHSRLLEVGGVKLRLLGLGGALVMHKLFDNGEGRTTIAGGQGTMWTTLLQMGELVDTANRTYDPTETRVLVTHASPSREGLLNQLAVALKADFSISGGLHFRYGSSYNEFSVNPTLDHFRGKLAASKASFQDVWETVKTEVEPIVAENEAHQKLLNNALEVVNKMPSVANGGNPFGGQAGATTGQIDEAAFKNMWNFNLADAAYGFLVLDVDNGRIGTEMKALGFNFSHRGTKSNPSAQDSLKANTVLPSAPTPTANMAPNVATPPYNPNVQPQAPMATAQQGIQQTRAGQQPRNQPPQQQALPPRPVHPSSASPQTQSAAQNQAAKVSTPAAKSTPQAQPSQASKAVAPVTNGTPTPIDSKPNGVGSPAPQADPASPSQALPKEPSSGIFVENSPGTTEDVKKLFSEEDQAKILRIDKIGQGGSNWHVRFSSPEEMQAVLAAQPEDTRKGSVNDRSKPRMKVFEQRGPRFGTYPSRGAYQGGYKSGGASDSEGGRGGRGGFRGDRGGRGGGRGGERGGRGRGRGGKTEGASASPAPATTGSGAVQW